MLLAGDIGGTKTVLAVIAPDRGPREPLAEETFPSARYPTLEALVRAFLDQVHLPVERAAFGVAGPVFGGRATATNLPWVMDAERLEHAELQPVVLRIVMRLAEDDVTRASRRLIDIAGRDEALGVRVPNPAGERRLHAMGAGAEGRERRAGGEQPPAVKRPRVRALVKSRPFHVRFRPEA